MYDVIPLIDKLTLQLKKAVEDQALSKLVWIAAAHGLGVLQIFPKALIIALDSTLILICSAYTQRLAAPDRQWTIILL